METVLELCEEHDIDPSDVKKLIDPSLKGQIEIEAAKLNMIKGNKETLDSFME